MTVNKKNNLLEVTDLKKHFFLGKGFLSGKKNSVRAVDGITFTMDQGETLGLVGESGCGKSTTAKLVLRLIEPTSGDIRLRGQSLLNINQKSLKKLRKRIQIIFQDPFSSLNPRMTAGSIIEEPLVIHKSGSRKERTDRVVWLMEKVGLTSEQMNRYPHEFSGGQQQRIGIARALALNPDIIIGDEPVSSLDVSIQAQVINLMANLQKEFRLSYLIIAHDLRVVQHVSNRIAVMYLGKIVELAGTEAIFESPRHPYTEALLSAIPKFENEGHVERIILTGDIPSPIDPPKGCHFHPRCPYKKDDCTRIQPELKENTKGHWVACLLR
jgi:oligopeptide/dipeptide ABC transporter ATP-binding protein